MNSTPTLPVVEALSWTLIHFIWQGALVALLLAIVKKRLRHRSANLRYLAACLGMLAMLALPLMTFVTLRNYSPASNLATLDQHSPIETGRQDSLSADLANYAVPAAEFSGLIGSPAGDHRGRFSQLAPWLISLWLAGVVVLSLRMLGGWLYARRLKNHLTGPLSEEWQRRFAQLRRDIRVLRPVRILESALVRVPTVIGWLRPVVLIPASALVGLTPSQLEAVIAHELAHIRRYDYLVNLLQTAVEIILFYHPAVWWVSREIRQEREHCCDDVAVEVCGDALVYARALTEIEVLRNITPRLAMAADGGSLLARIQRILGNSPEGSDRTASWLAGAIVFVSVFLPAAGAQFISHHNETASRSDLGSTAPATQIDAASTTTPAGAAPDVKPLNKQSEKSLGNLSAESSGEPASDGAPSIEMPSVRTPPVRTPSAETPSVVTPSVETPSVEAPRDQAAGGSFIDEMAALGYTNLSEEDLIALRNAGVSPQLVRELKSYGYDKLSIRELTRLSAAGITGQFIKEMKAAGIERASLDVLARLGRHGVSPALIRQLDDLGYKKLSADQLSEAATHGVTPQYIRGLQSAGYKDISIAEVARARDHGVDFEFINEIRERGYTNLDLRDFIRMRDHGVDGEFLRSMEAGGFAHLPVDQMVRAHDHGADAEFARHIHAAGFPNATLDQLIQMKDHDVDPAYIESIRKSGFDNLAIEHLVRLHDHGVDAEFIRRARSHGFQNLTIEQLIRLRDADVFN